MPGYELYGCEEREALLAWFDSNQGVMFAHGFDGIRRGVFKVREFERAVAQTVGAVHAQAVSSGSAALWVALRALGVGPGDEVITQAFTFVATVEAILLAGATPVVIEVDGSLTMDPDDLAAKITPRTKAVIPVHMAGAAADLGAILRIAGERGVPVLEDACQAFGGTYHGRPLGTLGTVGVYSFDFAKTITTGEGGMVVTNDRPLYKRARAFHDHGHAYDPTRRRGEDGCEVVGFNFRMTEAQAVLGLAQLQKLPQILERQRANKAAIKTAMADLGLELRRLHDPAGDIGDTLIFFLPTAEQAVAFAAGLAQAGVGTKNLPDALSWHFAGTWDHLFRGMPGLEHPQRCWPRTAAWLRRAVALPVSVKMSDAEVSRIVDAVRSIAHDVVPAARAVVG